jgi:KDO2-lipid IV(A) lauroyltransferase
LWIGKFLGGIFFSLNLRARAVAYANLRLAFAHKVISFKNIIKKESDRNKESSLAEFSPSFIKKILSEVFQHMGMNIVEVLRFPSLNERYVTKYIKIIGFDKIEKFHGKKKGLILLTAHFGNWELSAQVSSLRGFPMMVLATEQKHTQLNEFLNRYRSLHGCQVISKGPQLKEILRGLRGDKIVGMLCDQDGGREGIEADFFGRLCMTARGPFEIALRNDAVILPCFSVRERDGRHTIFIEDPLSIKDEKVTREEILKAWVEKFNKLLEEKIRKFPGQWLWTLKRWKSSRERAVVILSDGKAGHLNQAKAVAEAISEEFMRLGYRVIGDYQTKTLGYKIIEVKFENKFKENLFRLIAHFLSFRCLRCLRLLKFALREQSFLDLQRCYADIIISAGSSLAGVNLIMKAENLAKSVVVMKPTLPLSWFDLAIVPSHDLGAYCGENIVKTLGAPVYISPEFIKNKSKELMEKLRLENTRCISLFFGGDTSVFTYDPRQIKKIVEAAKEAANKLNTKILVTTSRRSPAWLEDFLEKEFSQDEKCALLLIANKNNISDAVAAFLGLTGVAIVSGESVSMVSEAVSTDRQLIVFLPPKRKAKLTKQEKLIWQLEKDGYLEILNDDPKEQIATLFLKRSKQALLSNKDKIKKAAKFLL